MPFGLLGSRGGFGGMGRGGGVLSAPPIPVGFTINGSGQLVKTADSSLWVYVTDVGAFVTDGGDYVLEAA